MTTRRELFVAASALAATSLSPFEAALAQAPQEPKEAEFLFVQSAKSMSFDKSTNKLTWLE